MSKGKVKDQLEELRREVIACLMLAEAEIDFGDTEEIDGDVVQQGESIFSIGDSV